MEENFTSMLISEHLFYLELSLGPLRLVKRGLKVLQVAVQVQQLGLLLARVALRVVALSRDALTIELLLGEDLVEVSLLLLEVKHPAVVMFGVKYILVLCS